jgi:hypothetical protein
MSDTRNGMVLLRTSVRSLQEAVLVGRKQSDVSMGHTTHQTLAK